jgi:hypothetical protein
MDTRVDDMAFVISIARDFADALSGKPSRYAFGTHVERMSNALKAYDAGHDAVEEQKRLFQKYDNQLDAEQEGARWIMG